MMPTNNTIKTELAITMVQPELIWEKVADNLDALLSLIASNERGDIVVLPEMFATGFTMNKNASGPETNHKISQWMGHVAKKFGCALVGSSAIVENGNFFNRLFCYSKTGEKVFAYDKRHLFTPGNEHKTYARGHQRECFFVEGWKIFPTVCYDLRFPVWCRNNQDYHLMVNVANWPAVRDSHWQALLRARAIENQAYVAGVNRMGIDGNGIEYIGNSCVFDFEGRVAGHMGIQPNTVKTVSLNFNTLLDYRKGFNTLADDDMFEIK